MVFTVDHDVEQLTHMGLSPEDAIDCLKACNNEPNRAAEYYWSGGLEESRKKLAWDESAWTAPREGPSSSSNERSYDNNWAHFQIQGPDVLSPAVFDGGTQSRPPSSPTIMCRGESHDAADPDLAKAMRASLQDVSGTSQYGSQEVGITSTHTSTPHFAPAVENKVYDPNKWALTTTETTREVISREPHPQERKREPGSPAFLRPSLASYNLASALTILHSIPQAREAFLSRSTVLPYYGHDPKWWCGEKIQSSLVIDIEREVERPGYSDAQEELAEIQRLMAFLDHTDRAYGCTDVIADMPRVQEHESSSVLSTFFRGWHHCLVDVYDTQEYPTVFSSSAHQVQTDGEDRVQEFQILEMTATPGDSTLYCALDNMIWAEEDSPVYVEFSDVFLIQLRTEANIQGAGIDIPAHLYLDRYSAKWLDIAKVVKGQIATHRSKLLDIEQKEGRAKCFRARNGSEWDPRKLLEITIEHFAVPLTPISDDDISMDSQPELPDPTPMLKELLRKTEKKLANLERQKKEAQEVLRKLKQSYTSPEDPRPDGLPPLTKYSLWGVSTDPNTTYVLIRSQQQPGTETQADAAPEQWWCCQWTIAKETIQKSWDNSIVWDDTPIGSYTTTKVTEEEVLLAAKTQGDSVLLVYANEKAFEGGDPSLPESLKAFVETDNAEFAAELSPPVPVPSPSPERKRRMAEDEEMGDQSPKRSLNSTRSSAIGNTTPLDTSSDPGNISTNDIEIPPPVEMMERGKFISPIAKALHLPEPPPVIDRKISDTDEDMPDVEHIERAIRKGG